MHAFFDKVIFRFLVCLALLQFTDGIWARSYPPTGFVDWINSAGAVALAIYTVRVLLRGVP